MGSPGELGGLMNGIVKRRKRLREEDLLQVRRITKADRRSDEVVQFVEL